MIKKIISGGQTGADQGGLEAGLLLGLETGGTAPLGYRTEKGANPKLGSEFKLGEDPSYNYSPRTLKNVRNSDGTVIFGNPNSPGCRLTIHYCSSLLKPFIVNPTKHGFLTWIEANNIQTLNVAGNRESTNPRIQEKVRNFLCEALSMRY